MNIYQTERQSKVDEYKQLMDHHAQFGAQYNAVVEAMPELTRVSVCTADLTVSISGDKHKLEAAWGALRSAGFKGVGTRPTKSQPEWCGRFEHESGAVIYVVFASTVCRRVKVGTKSVETDIYETICDEQEPYAVQA